MVSFRRVCVSCAGRVRGVAAALSRTSIRVHVDFFDTNIASHPPTKIKYDTAFRHTRRQKLFTECTFTVLEGRCPRLLFADRACSRVICAPYLRLEV